MVFKKDFTEEKVIGLLKGLGDEASLMRSEIQKHLGCSKKTAENLLQKMSDDETLVKVNRGSDKKKILFYSLNPSRSYE